MMQEISGFLDYAGAERGFSPKTVGAYRHDLDKFSEFAVTELGEGYQLEDIAPEVIKAYLRSLTENGNAAITRGRKLATLKSFFKYLTIEGRLKINPAIQFVMPKVKEKEPSYLTEQEYKRLLNAVYHNASKYFKERDLAIVTALLGMGLRLSELVELNVGDVNVDDGAIKVTRKGNHERILPASREVITSIQRYLITRTDTRSHDPLFLSKLNQRIDSASVWRVVKKYLKQARIEKEKLSPHTLRHTFATTLLKQGENLLTIKKLLSHRNLRTTERYLHIHDQDLRSAVGKIDLATG